MSQAIGSVLRTRLGLVWLGLVAATAVSFGLGTDHGLDGADAHAVGISIALGIAFAKIAFIGWDFMELRDAPLLLRGCFFGWCVIVGVGVIVLFLLGQ